MQTFEDAVRFKKAVKKYTKKICKSKKSARKALVKQGTYTKEGDLTIPYRDFKNEDLRDMAVRLYVLIEAIEDNKDLKKRLQEILHRFVLMVDK